MEILAELPDGISDRFAFGLERRQDAQGAFGVAGEPGLGQLEDVVPRDIGDGRLHRLECELTRGQDQRELFDFLPRGEQVAFATVREKGQYVARRALVLACEARRDPLWKRLACKRLHPQI